MEWMVKGADGTDQQWTKSFLTKEIQEQALALHGQRASLGSWHKGRLRFDPLPARSRRTLLSR